MTPLYKHFNVIYISKELHTQKKDRLAREKKRKKQTKKQSDYSNFYWGGLFAFHETTDGKKNVYTNEKMQKKNKNVFIF